MDAMIPPIVVEPREGWCIWLRFEDGTEGEIDLSDVALQGVFAAWSDRAFFESVHLTPHGSVAWSEELDLCADALYLELTGKSAEEVMPGLRALEAGA